MALKKREVFSAVVQAGLPHTQDAEQAVIGTILATPSSVLSSSQQIVSEYFFDPIHKIVISAISDLVFENKPPDLTLVYNRLREKGDNLKIGDLEGLRRFLDYNSRPEFLGYWLEEVKKYWELRTIIETCSEIVTKGRQVAGANVENFLSYAESKFAEIAESRVVGGLTPVSSVVQKTLEEFEALFKREGQLTGVPTGFKDLDQITSGFQNSDLIILAARPAMGKTSLALNFAYNAVFHAKKTVAFFSLEMSSTQLMQRMLATAAKIDSNKFRNGKMSTEDFDKLYPEVSKFQTDNLLFDDTPGISIIDLASRCRKVKRERGALDLVIVDYLQLMSAGQMHRGMQNREREISIISMGLKNLAKELNCPVIALSQLNRGLEMRPDKRPRPSDLRECVTGDTLVNLADGRRIPIADLEGQTPKVLSITEKGKIVAKKSSAVWCVGEKKVYTVNLASGRNIKATLNHRLMGATGWKELSDFKVGDRVAIARWLHEPLEKIDIFWDKIISIEEGEIQKVYDMTVPKTESWLADGIICHNSGSLEQDSDLILFVYRDEVYNPDTEDKGIAEIIIGKNRHGPIDTVQLAFQSNYTAFFNLSKMS